MPYDNLREQALAPDRSPIWWRGELGKRFLYLFGAAHDHYVQYLWGGVMQRFPSFAGPVARQQLSRDRRVPIFKTEPVPSQQDRLRKWRSAHRQAGTDTGILTQSRPFWLPDAPLMRVVAGNSKVAMWTTLQPNGDLQFHRHDVSTGGSNWDWDSAHPFHTEPKRIHRWFLIVYAPPNVTPQPIVAEPSETISVGSSLSVQQTLDVYNLAKNWRRAGSVLWGWILAFDQASFDPLGGPGPGYPDGTWFRSYNLDGSFNRLPTARYHVTKNWTL